MLKILMAGYMNSWVGVLKKEIGSLLLMDNGRIILSFNGMFQKSTGLEREPLNLCRINIFITTSMAWNKGKEGKILKSINK